MKPLSPLDNLVIRTAVVRQLDVGYIIACDPKQEKEEIPHAITFRWNAGKFNKGSRNYDAHTGCLIQQPEPGFLDASGQGYYSINTKGGMTSGDILENSAPRPKKRRTASFRSVAEVAGKAYAVGLRGLVYRLDELTQWARIDEGLPETFDIQAIHGFGGSDLYAVGREGELWQLDGSKWVKRELPTNANLTAVRCAGNGKTYIAGHGGLLIEGKGSAWSVIEHGETEDDIWDIEWFDEEIFVSTMKAVYRLKRGSLSAVKFGEDAPKTCYQLSSASGVMWSNGERDVVSYDGSKWTRVV